MERALNKDLTLILSLTGRGESWKAFEETIHGA
jgi:hypothetical protein